MATAGRPPTSEAEAPGARRRPNLLLIYSDQHSPAIAGCYGDPVVDTPHLDALAAQGTTLDAAYCPSPLCVPSRMAFLTGQHPHQIGVWTNEHQLDPAIPTFAHALGAAGYRPTLIGRMHIVGPDQLHGFAERLVGDHRPNHIGGRPVDHGVLTGTTEPHRISLTKSGVGQSAYQLHDEDVTAATVAHLDRLGALSGTGHDDPFALCVGFMLPHQPFVAQRDDFERYRDRVPPPRIAEPFSERLHPHLRSWRRSCGIEEVPNDEVERARTAYYALVTRLDAMIGEILTVLRRNRLDRDTLVVYLSDHGEQLGEHGLWWKQTFYEHSVRVPCILSWPGVLPQGERCQRVVSTQDVTATLLDATGAPPLPRSPGRSLLPLLRTPVAVSWEDVALSEFCTDEGNLQRMVRLGRWKLIHYHRQPPQLFDLQHDPDERENRAADPVCGSLVEELTARVLTDWNPLLIEAELARKRRDNALLRTWAERVRPPDAYRWELRPEMQRLESDDPPATAQGAAEP